MLMLSTTVAVTSEVLLINEAEELRLFYWINISSTLLHYSFKWLGWFSEILWVSIHLFTTIYCVCVCVLCVCEILQRKNAQTNRVARFVFYHQPYCLFPTIPHWFVPVCARVWAQLSPYSCFYFKLAGLSTSCTGFRLFLFDKVTMCRVWKAAKRNGYFAFNKSTGPCSSYILTEGTQRTSFSAPSFAEFLLRDTKTGNGGVSTILHRSHSVTHFHIRHSCRLAGFNPTVLFTTQQQTAASLHFIVILTIKMPDMTS